MSTFGLLAPLFDAIGSLVSSIIDQLMRGDDEGAQERVEFFVALSKAELDSDRRQAERALRSRFPNHGEFDMSIDSDPYADLD